MDEKYQPEDFFTTPSTIRLELEDESEEETYLIRVGATPEPFGLDFEDDDNETQRAQHLDATNVEAHEENTEVIIKKEDKPQPMPTKKEDSWSWPAAMPEKKQDPISLMEDLESYGYRLNAEGSVWIAPPLMKNAGAIKPPRPVTVKKEESSLVMAKVEAEESEQEPEPFGYRCNDDGTFYDE